MGHGRTRRSVWISVVLLLGLLMVACGGESSGASSGAGSQDLSGSTASVPDGPDTPASGAPGQSGGLAGGAGVQGQVTDAAGRPLAGVLVTPQSTDNPPHGVPEIAVQTDDQGHYQWTLAPGQYTLTFAGEGYGPQTKAVVVNSGQSATLDVTLNQQ